MRSEVLNSYKDYEINRASVICLGNFDGLHIGHQRIVSTCLAEARQLERRSVIFTFDPHPMKVLRPNTRSLSLLFTPEEKREFLTRIGADVVLLQNFTLEFARTSAASFATEILSSALNAKSVVIGNNFRFGEGAKGNIDLLKSQSHLYQVKEVSAVEEEGLGVVSSSVIREKVQNGEVELAQKLLNYPYFLSGHVVAGEKRGRELGFPTANIFTQKECLPKIGIYVTVLEDLRTGLFFPAATSVGRNPTFHSSAPVTIESHVIDFEGDLYNRDVRLFFLNRIRDEKKYESVDALKIDIERDVQFCKSRLRALQLMQGTDSDKAYSFHDYDPQAQTFEPYRFLKSL